MPDLEELSRDELVQLVRAQAARLEDQAALLEAQATELERLKRLMSRNSGNSLMPPSTDDLSGRTKPSSRLLRS